LHLSYAAQPINITPNNWGTSIFSKEASHLRPASIAEVIALLAQSDRKHPTAFCSEAVAYARQRSGDLEKTIASDGKILTSADHSLGWEPQQRWLEDCYPLASDYLWRGEK
jgi:hypothetical protein